MILIAGKGHEDYQVFGAEKRPYAGDMVLAQDELKRSFSSENDA